MVRWYSVKHRSLIGKWSASTVSGVRYRSATTYSDNSSLDSIISYCERALRTAEPLDKVAITLECQQRWQQGELSVWSGKGWNGNPPREPARGIQPQLLPPKRMPSPKDMEAPLPIVMLHALAHIELGAIDNYLDTLVRYDPHQYGLTREFYDDFLTVASDEARHFKMVHGRLCELGSFYGALPATTALLDHAANTTSALASRIAVVPLVQEARGLDSGDRLVHKLRSMGDKFSAKLVEQIVFEEQRHVSYGIKWFKYLCAQNQKDPITYFHELVRQHFPEGLPGPFDVEARLAANMEPAWYVPLKTTNGKRNVRTPVYSTSITKTGPLDKAPQTKTVILAGSVWPERTSSAAGVRSSEIVDIMREYGYMVICVSPCRPNEHTELLHRENNVKCVQADANTDVFKNLVTDVKPEIVVFDRFVAEEMYGWQAKQYAPQALRVLDLQDVHFVRKAREFLVTKQSEPFTSTLDMMTLDVDPVEKDVIRELASIHRSDLTLYVSDIEREVLVNRFEIPGDALHKCDFFYRSSKRTTWPSFSDRNNIAFIGSFKHAPNIDAIKWLKRTIAPEFRRLLIQQPNLKPPEIHVFGSYSAKYAALDDPSSGFRLKGFTSDVHDTLCKYRINVAPLRFGGGIKGKIADGWYNGTPSVATSIGAEGMYGCENDGHLMWGGIVSDEPAQFARGMVDLYTNETLWSQAQQQGYNICSTKYDRASNALALMTSLENALIKRDIRRGRHWTSRILWSEKYRATEFMSRFIQLKNEMKNANRN